MRIKEININQDVSVFKFKNVGKLNQVKTLGKTKYFGEISVIDDSKIAEIASCFKKDRTVRIEINKNEINKNAFSNILKIINKMGNDKRVEIVISSDMRYVHNTEKLEYLYDNEQKNLLIDFYKMIKGINKKSNMFFSEVDRHSAKSNTHSKFWTLEQVLRTNFILEDIICGIKQMGLTPVETVLFVYRFLMENFTYSEDDKLMENARVLPSILAEKKYNIVCAGYATLFKAIIDGLKLQEVDCRLISGLVFTEDQKNFGHTCNLIDVKDEEYKINGIFISDNCTAKPDCENDDDLGFWESCLIDFEGQHKIIPFCFRDNIEISRYDQAMSMDIGKEEAMEMFVAFKNGFDEFIVKRNKKIAADFLGKKFEEQKIIDVGNTKNHNEIDCFPKISADCKAKAICKIKEKYEKCFNSELSYTEMFKKIQAKYFLNKNKQNNDCEMEL